MISLLMNKVNCKLQNKVSTNFQVLIIDFYLIKHLNNFNVLVEKYIWNLKKIDIDNSGRIKDNK